MDVTDPNRDLFSCVRGEHGARRRNPLASIAKARAQRRLVSSSVTECSGRRIETRHRRSSVALAEVTRFVSVVDVSQPTTGAGCGVHPGRRASSGSASMPERGKALRTLGESA